MRQQPRHIGLQFGHIRHFNEGLAEYSRQLAFQFAGQALQLKEERNWHFHFILPKQWHGMFGDCVRYHELTDSMRLRHRFPVDLDTWHGLHQHMRFRPPVNSRRNIITVHDLNHVYAKKGLSLWWQNLRLTKQLRRADQLVSISQFVANDVAKHLPWTPATQVIHNGVADLTQNGQTPINDLTGAEYLLHISRMSPSKNVGALLEMATIWPEQLVVLAGPASEEIESHKQRASNMQLKNVRFLTDVSEGQKAWLYANARAFLFPSLLEGFGLPPIEAMYFGKPVVVATCTSLPEVCGTSAYYWESFSPEAMRQTVEKAIALHERSSEQALATRLHAAQYSWGKAAWAYLNLYGLGG